MDGGMENNGGGGESSPSVVGASKVKKAATDFFPDKAHVTDALRSILAGLDASEPTLVYEKHMPPSDRSKGQNRLLMSCKCERKRAAFASIFTEKEMPLVHRPEPLLKTEEDEEEHDDNDHGGKDDKGKHKRKKKDGGEDNSNKRCRNNGNGEHKTNDDGGGKEDTDKDDDEQGKQKSMVRALAVQAYDCDGRVYELNLKYLSSNTGYRIIGPDYTVFLKNNGLLVGGGGGVTRKRSAGRRQKKRRSSLPPDEEPPNDERRPAVRDAAGDIQMELWAFRSPKLSIGEKDQPDGALGLLLLHYRGGEAGQQDRDGGAAAAAAAAEEVQQVAGPQEPEVVVDVEQPQQSSHDAMVTQGEDTVAGADAATVVDDAAGELGQATQRSTPDLPLRPLERLIAVWLMFHSCYAQHPHGC
jgi:hypothetical protein